MDPVSPAEALWHPPASAFTESNLARYQRWVSEHYGVHCSNYRELYDWSVTQIGPFWKSIAEYFAVQFERQPEEILVGEKPLGAHWFPGATLNYAAHLLRGRSEFPDRVAIIARTEPEPGGESGRAVLTYAELGQHVFLVAAALRQLGVRKGDRVAGYLPNCPETVIAFLASASLGAIWSGCPPELSSKGVLERLIQIEPKVLFAISSYRYGGKIHDRRSALGEIVAGLPTLQRVVHVSRPDAELTNFLPPRLAVDWRDFSASAEGGSAEGALEFETVEFEHPLWILYSSGTTGIPKPIVHGHGGMLLEHLKALSLHLDLREGDRFFWFTTAGWMMWNFLISGLALKTTIVLYDGSPKYPDFGVLWRLAGEEGMTYFGTSAPFLQACAKENIHPQRLADLKQLRAIGSTGAPLPPEGFRWVYNEVKSDVWLGSVSGGTDVCTAFILSNPLVPVYAGKLQCRGLGAPIEAWNEDAKPVWNEVGELVLTAPMPCMPVRFWNDPDGSRMRASYFEHFPGIWRHGDWIEISVGDGQCVIYGRSDSTLNRGGIRMGTAEFYRVIEKIPAVLEALVIDTTGFQQNAVPGRLLLFVVLSSGRDCNDALREAICAHLRAELSPRYVPDAIFSVPEIPHTLNGKKLEVPVKRLFEGTSLAKAISREAVANPGSLQYFVELAARL
ncbi:MAG: acetoacetate--CoA ligase [Chthoniobacterales bacterium]